MKNNAEKILFLLLLTCSSCSSIYRFSIDIQEPAAITLPVSAQNVLILNNTITQPENYGIERTFDGKSIRADYPLSLDSMVWSVVDAITAVLNESNFFNTIAIYKAPLRSDSDTEWLSITEISSETQSDFYDTENYDALFVIDRLLLSVNENVKTIQTGSLSSEPSAFVDMRADGIITCSMYVYGKEQPLITFNVSDSLFTKSVVDNDSILLFKEIPEYMLDELSHRIGNQAATHFIPTWETAERILFASYNSRMQEAAGYAVNHQWAKAEPIWTAELGKKTKPLDRAKIAFNLAVANEMQDKFEPALEWVQKAKEYLTKTNSSNNSKEIALIDEYISELERRIQNNHLLDLQWGKE